MVHSECGECLWNCARGMGPENDNLRFTTSVDEFEWRGSSGPIDDSRSVSGVEFSNMARTIAEESDRKPNERCV